MYVRKDKTGGEVESEGIVLPQEIHIPTSQRKFSLSS